MINLPAIYVANGSAIFLILSVAISRKRNIHFRLFDERLFSAMLAVNVAVCVTETLSFVVDGRSPELFRVPSLLLNSANFLFNIVLTSIWTLYVEYKLTEDVRKLRRSLPFLAVPALAVALGSVVNLFTPVFFSVSADNVYGRTSFGALVFGLTYMYLLHGVVRVLLNRDRSKRYLFMPIILFMLPVFIASALQLAFYGLSLIWLGTAVGMVALYVNVQNQAAYLDPLSGVFNRQYLNHFLASWAERQNHDQRLLGFMLDIDDFKAINDRYGHLAGDGAIARVGGLLRVVTAHNGFASRYGGDEFIVIRRLDKGEDAEQCVDRVKKQIRALSSRCESEVPLSMSVGCAAFEDGDTVDSFLGRMDREMYAEKNRRIKDCALPDRRRTSDG